MMSIRIRKKLKGEWVDGLLPFRNEMRVFTTHKWNDEGEEREYATTEDVRVIAETVREYANLMDCDFNKIFNGDLLKDEDGRIWLMTYATGWWSYQIVSQNTKVQQHCTVHPLTRVNVGDYLPSMKIIGNKFNNLELLKD